MMDCPNCNRKREISKLNVIYLDNGEILNYSICPCGFYWYVYSSRLLNFS